MHTCHGYKTASAEVPIVGNLSLSILTTKPRSAYGHKTASPEVPPEGAIQQNSLGRLASSNTKTRAESGQLKNIYSSDGQQRDTSNNRKQPDSSTLTIT